MYCVFNSSSFIDLNSIDKNYMTVMSGECQVVSLQPRTWKKQCLVHLKQSKQKLNNGKI